MHVRERQGGTPSSGPLKSAIYLVRSLFSYGISVSRRREGEAVSASVSS